VDLTESAGMDNFQAKTWWSFCAVSVQVKIKVTTFANYVEVNATTWLWMVHSRKRRTRL